MNYRYAIQKELLEIYHTKGPNNYVLANTLRSFSPGNQGFLVAVNQLLAEREILSVSTSDQQMAVCINPERIPLRENAATSANPWLSGSFYLVAAVLLLSALGVLARQVSSLALPVILLAGILLVIAVGLLQLRSDDRLREATFARLVL